MDANATTWIEGSARATAGVVGLTAVISLALLSSAGAARAEAGELDVEPVPSRLRASPINDPAPRRAFEAIVDVGFIQPTGGVSAGHSVESSVGGGVDLGLGLGYRLSPFWSVDLRGQFHDSQSRAPASGGDVRGVAIVAGPTLHLLPYELVDPYVSVSTGYRLLMEHLDGTDAQPVTSGLDLLRIQIGMDLRTTTSSAVSVYVAGDLTTFLWSSSDSSFGTLSGTPKLSAFLSAGAQARFDFGGIREKRATLAWR